MLAPYLISGVVAIPLTWYLCHLYYNDKISDLKVHHSEYVTKQQNAANKALLEMQEEYQEVVDNINKANSKNYEELQNAKAENERLTFKLRDGISVCSTQRSRDSSDKVSEANETPRMGSSSKTRRPAHSRCSTDYSKAQRRNND